VFVEVRGGYLDIGMKLFEKWSTTSHGFYTLFDRREALGNFSYVWFWFF
jgi:hypothetical protein